MEIVRPPKVAILLAAGFGQRLRPLSLIRPKPLFPVLNQTQLGWWLARLKAADVETIVVNAHHLGSMVLEEVEKERSLHPSLDVRVSFEPEILGTGGGVKKAAEGFRETMIVANSDIRTDLDLISLWAAHYRLGRPPATLALLDEPAKATVSLGAKGEILGFRSPSILPGEEKRLCGAGIVVLEPQVLDLIPDGASDLIEVLSGCFPASPEREKKTAHGKSELEKSELGKTAFGKIARPPAGVRLPMSQWLDMGAPGDYFSLVKFLAGGGRYWGGPGARAGDSESPPWPGVEIEGFGCAEPGAAVGPGAKLKDCVLLREARIGAGARLNECVVAGEAPEGISAEKTIFGPQGGIPLLTGD